MTSPPPCPQATDDPRMPRCSDTHDVMCAHHGHVCDERTAVRTSAQLRALRYSRTRIERALETGELIRLRRGVFATPSSCDDVRRAARAGGRLACISAARHLGIWVLSDDDHLHLRCGHHSRTPTIIEADTIVHWGDAPTPRATARSVLREIDRCAGTEQFFVALESSLRLGLVAPHDLAWLHERTNDRAREAIAFARDDADSGLESLIRWRLRHWQLDVRAQVSVLGVGRVDLLIDGRLIVEADGRENHAGAERRHHDLVRDAASAAWGYRTLRFDYALIVHDWDLVERAILGALGLG